MTRKNSNRDTQNDNTETWPGRIPKKNLRYQPRGQR